MRRDVALAYRNYESAKSTVEVLRTGVVGQNQESFQIVRLAYQLGELRLLDVLNQQRLLIDAQTAYASPNGITLAPLPTSSALQAADDLLPFL